MLPHRPAPKVFWLKFFLSLIRPTNVFLSDPETNTKPFSDTTALRNPIKTITELSSLWGEELLKVLIKHSGHAERGARTRSFFFFFPTFVVTETELWTTNKAEQHCVLLDPYVPAVVVENRGIPADLPEKFPKAERFSLSASGSYWRQKQHQPRCPGIRQRTK